MSDILTGDTDEPGAWEHRSVWGGAITFNLPLGVSVGGFDVAEDEYIELVLDVRDQYEIPEDEKDAEVWAVAYNPDRIVMNHKGVATTLHETKGLHSAAEWANEWMRDNPGDKDD